MNHGERRAQAAFVVRCTEVSQRVFGADDEADPIHILNPITLTGGTR